MASGGQAEAPSGSLPAPQPQGQGQEKLAGVRVEEGAETQNTVCAGGGVWSRKCCSKEGGPTTCGVGEHRPVEAKGPALCGAPPQ